MRVPIGVLGEGFGTGFRGVVGGGFPVEHGEKRQRNRQVTARICPNYSLAIYPVVSLWSRTSASWRAPRSGMPYHLVNQQRRNTHTHTQQKKQKQKQKQTNNKNKSTWKRGGQQLNDSFKQSLLTIWGGAKCVTSHTLFQPNRIYVRNLHVFSLPKGHWTGQRLVIHCLFSETRFNVSLL